MRKVVLVDIDHTLSDASWRDPMIGVESWDEYHSQSVHDQPIKEMIQLVNGLAAVGFYIAGVTSRPNKWRQITHHWLVQNEVFMHEILMRSDDAFHPAPELKMALAAAKFKVPDEISLVIDDRDDVCSAFRALGITTLQVSAGVKI